MKICYRAHIWVYNFCPLLGHFKSDFNNLWKLCLGDQYQSVECIKTYFWAKIKKNRFFGAKYPRGYKNGGLLIGEWF